MVISRNNQPRVIAIDPFTKGFGYVILEGPTRLVDWGIKSVRCGQNGIVLKKIEVLIAQNQPCILAIEDAKHPSCLRRIRLSAQLQEIFKTFDATECSVQQLSRESILQTFSTFEVQSKSSMVQVLVSHFPELEDIAPPHRKPWMSEDPRFSIFDALALAWTSFSGESNQNFSAKSGKSATPIEGSTNR